MSLRWMIDMLNNPAPEPDIELSPEQREQILKGKIIWVVEKGDFRPRIYAVGLRNECDPKNITNDDVIVRDITNALTLANYDLDKVRDALRK